MYHTRGLYYPTHRPFPVPQAQAKALGAKEVSATPVETSISTLLVLLAIGAAAVALVVA